MSKSERAEARTRATLERGAAKRPGAPAPTRANETSESERAEARTRATLERGAAERPGAPAPTRANETSKSENVVRGLPRSIVGLAVSRHARHAPRAPTEIVPDPHLHEFAHRNRVQLAVRLEAFVRAPADRYAPPRLLLRHTAIDTHPWGPRQEGPTIYGAANQSCGVR